MRDKQKIIRHFTGRPSCGVPAFVIIVVFRATMEHVTSHVLPSSVNSSIGARTQLKDSRRLILVIQKIDGGNLNHPIHAIPSRGLSSNWK